jgi:hypothetical protein
MGGILGCRVCEACELTRFLPTVFCADRAIASVHFGCALWRQSIFECYSVADDATVAICLVCCRFHVGPLAGLVLEYLCLECSCSGNKHGRAGKV